MSVRERIAFELRAGPLAEADLAVSRVEGREGLSEPYAIEVEFAPVDGEPFDLEAVLGREAVLTVRRPGGGERVVHGEALRAELAAVSAGRPLYRIVISPKLARLARVVRSRIFVGKSAPEVVDEVLSEHGIAHRLDLAGSYPAREMTVQHREPDLAFVSRLLEAEGIWYRFEHADGGHELVIADAPGAYVEAAAALPLRQDAAQGEGVEHVSRLERTHRLVTGAVALGDFDFERPALDLGASASAASAPEVYEWPGGYREPGEGRRLGQARLEELRHGTETFEGRSTGLAVEPGTVLEIEGEAKVLAVRVVHRGTQERAGGAGEIRATYENAFEGIEGTRTYRPRRRTPVPRIAGIVTATVVGAAGEEIHTDRHGRVKVLFHWDREGARDDRSSAWVRLAQAWAGAGMGASFVPRVGQEVVVRFLEGDPDRPLVVGAVYNGANPPPVELPLDKTRSTLRTDSSPGSGGANELRLEDRAGAEEVYLHAQKDHLVEVEDDERREVRTNAGLGVERDREKRVMGSQRLDVAGADASAVGGAATLTVAAGRDTAVEASHEERVAAAQTLTVAGSRNVSAALASAQLVGAAAALNVGAGYAVNVGGAVNEAVAGMKSSQVAAESAEVVGAARTERVAGDRGLTIGSDDAAEVVGTVGQKADGDRGDTVGGGLALGLPGPASWHAAGQALEATDRLSLLVDGKVVLSMTSGGEVQLLGANLTLDASSLALKGSKVAKASPAGPQNQQAQVPAIQPGDAAWIEIHLEDEDGNPVPNEPFKVEFPDGSVKEGRLGADGKARVHGPRSGNCKVSFPRLDGGTWRAR